MAKKTLATSVPQELYDRVKERTDQEQVSIMKWMETAVIEKLDGPKVSDLTGPMVGLNVTTQAGVTTPHNPCWVGRTNEVQS